MQQGWFYGCLNTGFTAKTNISGADHTCNKENGMIKGCTS